MLGGHIPLELNTEIRGIPVVQPYENTGGYADVVLTVDRARRTSSVPRRRPTPPGWKG